MHIPPGYSNVTFVISRAGDLDPYTSSFGVDYPSPAVFSTASADAFAASLKAATLPNLGLADTLVSIDFAYNDGAGVATYSSPINSVGTGASANSVTTQNVAALFSKKTNLPGRKGRGRMFWPYVEELNVSSVGVLDPTFVTKLQTMCTAWRTSITTASLFDSMILFHTATTPDPAIVTSLTVASVVATQRRRLRR